MIEQIKIKNITQPSMKYLSAWFEELLHGRIDYGSGSTEKMMLSILIDVAKKFTYNPYAPRNSKHTKSLKFHEAMAMLAFVSYLIQIESDPYGRSILIDIQITIDKKI